MAGNLRAAINQAMGICWDESIGYKLGGMGYSTADGVDCSGLIGRVLYDNGFNYPAWHVGTMYMKDWLVPAGFQIIYPSSLSDLRSQIKSGDIVVMNHLDWSGGHTFFYVEDIRAYTDYTGDSPSIGIVHKAKVEASSSRGTSGNGDSRKNGTGAYWQVWCHAYWDLVTGYDPTDPNDEVYIARWPGGLDGRTDIMMLKRIRDGQFNIDSWTNKFMDDGI